MSSARIIGFIAACLGGVAQIGYAQSQTPVPAEFPPASYDANQYVDSAGCVFVRAGMAGTVNWVPRLSRDRQQLCGFEPTIGAAIPSPLPANVPIITIDQPAAPAAAPRIIADPITPPTTNRDPMETVASVTTMPSMQTISSRVIADAAAAAPVLTPAPVVREPEPVRMTMTQVCEGKYGVQRQYINAATGEFIDCGPAPVTQVATVAPTAPAGDTRCTNLSQAVTTSGRNVEVRCGPQTQSIWGGNRIPASNPVPVATSTGTSYVPVDRPATAVLSAPVASASSPAPTVVPAAPVAAPVPSSCNFDSVSAQYMAGANVRCGPQTQSPSGGVARSSAQAGRASFNPSTGGLFGRAVPASNPPYVANGEPIVPNGYEVVWDDDRLNPNRGLN
ncbi:hypothetical protein BVC71_10150 [Marivivens niveibacter]|uniref:Uncharacterized protein n=1 Tax=Marivivens niveibacter TaxID=1930667 RepID=A0A251WXJ4_9RHOB|nr:hypothetical protein [Marivivens niveibacter]OUD09066.1 hypothetical protein BVC71_10150 [Marivivens niveibacter]